MMDTLIYDVNKPIDINGLQAEIRASYPTAIAVYIKYDNGTGQVHVYDVASSEYAAVGAIVAAHDIALVPVPRDEAAKDARPVLAAGALDTIQRSPLARAILEGGDLSDYTIDQIISMQNVLIRFMFSKLYDLIWPAWSFEARSE